MTGDDSCSCTTFLPPNHVALTYTPKPIIPARRPTKRCNSVGPSVFRPRMPYAGLLAVILHLPRWSMVIHHRQHLHVVQNFKAHAPLYIISRRPYAMHPGRMRVRMIACISILVDTVVDVIMHTCEGVRHSGGANMRPAHLQCCCAHATANPPAGGGFGAHRRSAGRHRWVRSWRGRLWRHASQHRSTRRRALTHAAHPQPRDNSEMEN